MKISVIIPAFNEAKNITKTISHIRKASRVNKSSFSIAEILVVDGGSDDGTRNLAKKAGAKVLLSPKKGRGAQLHHGAVHAVGDLFYFVHADVLPPLTFVEDIAKAVDQEWPMGLFEYCFDSSAFLLRVSAFFTRFRWLFTLGGDRTFFILREIYFRLGGYDPEFVIMEEYDFLRRAKKAGYDLVVLPCKCIVSSRKYENNSWLRVQLANFVAYNLWAWGGASPLYVRKVYTKLLR